MRLVSVPSTPLSYIARWLTNSTVQSTERKNALELELHENLKRKREELRAKLESLDAPALTQGSSPLGDVESRKSELKGLNKTIKGLEAKIEGMCFASLSL